MKVVVLSAAYPTPSEPERGLFIENLTRCVRAALREEYPDAEISVVAPRVRFEDPSHERRNGVHVRRFRYPSGGRRLKELGEPALWRLVVYVVSGVFATLRTLRRERPDVLLCHWVLPTGPIGAVAAAAARVPLVVMAHGSDINVYAENRRLRRRLVLWVLRRAARVIAVSDALRHRLETRFGVPPARLTQISAGVDSRHYHLRDPASRTRMRQALGFDGADRIVLFVGDLIPAKGVPELLAAWRRVAPSAGTLCCIGDGPLAAQCRQEADQSVRVLGPMAPTLLAVWYEVADFLVLPSHSEGTPLVVMEALACGLPVVATRVGGIPDLVEDGYNGRLLEAKDVDGLREVLARLLSAPAELQALRDGARATEPGRYSVTSRSQHLREALREVHRGH